MNTNTLAVRSALGLQEKAPRTRIWSRAIVTAGLVLTLGGATSWGQVPATNDTSDADWNTGGGTGALGANTEGGANTAYGFKALMNNTEGNANTAIGSTTLQDNTTGTFNTATGSNALEDNTTGIENTATGVGALHFNTTGDSNTASGVAALHLNTAGRDNTASGVAALQFNTTGDANTACGFKALMNNTTGSNNIAVGTEAGAALTSGDDNVYLGNPGGTASESTTMRLGQNQTSTFIAGIRGTVLSSNTAQAVYITSAGQLGVKSSSARYKRDIQPMGKRSQKLQHLRPVTFHYKQDPQGALQYGLIAEEVAKVYPELVVRGTKGEVESVEYHELIPMLLNEVQHQQQELAELKAQNDRLQAALVQQNAALAARLERLEEGAVRAATLATR